MVGHATAALGAAEAQLDQRHVVPPLVDQLLQVRLRRVMAGSAPDVQPQELRREHAIPLSIDTNRGGWVALPSCHAARQGHTSKAYDRIQAAWWDDAPGRCVMSLIR